MRICSRTKMPNAVRRDNAVLEPSRMFNDKFASLRHSLLHRDLRFGRPDTDEGGDRAGIRPRVVDTAMKRVHGWAKLRARRGDPRRHPDGAS
jgi:hypothetical protein